MQLAHPRIEVSVANQTLSLWDGRQQIRQWPCATSKFGLGSEEGSYKTPLGHFEIAEKFGEEADAGTIFRSRRPVGHWEPGMDTDEDLVLTRILWLEGLEDHNANTHDRYVYIHGTNGEDRIGRPSSHGCVRMRNRDVIELFDLVHEGAPVWIEE